jgi:tetratricopeptide (TPR) repeat protein
MQRERPRPALLLAALAALLAAPGCARGARGPGAPPEVLVEVLPRSAAVELDGRPLGRGSRAVPAPPGADEHVLRVSAEGYEAEERRLPAGSLAGARVGAALRPRGFPSGRLLDYDDAAGLAAAAAFLARAGPAEDAADYAERAVALEPGSALAHLALGDALVRMGRRDEAMRLWSRYLRLTPEAPDADVVARRMEEVRGGRGVR